MSRAGRYIASTPRSRLEDFTSKAIQAVADLRRYIDDLDKLDGWGAPTSQAVAPTLSAHLQQRKALFIGREPEIETLRRQLQEPGALAYISGVAGRGKTALALEYAHRYKGDFESVHWIPCQERTLVQMAGELAWQLGLKPEGELDMIVRELNGHCARKRCLLVLDNVDDEAPSRLIPGGCTSVLVTTRLTNLPFLRHHQPLQLPLFTEEQCFELFRREIGKEEVDRHRRRRARSSAGWVICLSASRWLRASSGRTCATPSRAWRRTFQPMPTHCSAML